MICVWKYPGFRGWGIKKIPNCWRRLKLYWRSMICSLELSMGCARRNTWVLNWSDWYRYCNLKIKRKGCKKKSMIWFWCLPSRGEQWNISRQCYRNTGICCLRTRKGFSKVWGWLGMPPTRRCTGLKTGTAINRTHHLRKTSKLSASTTRHSCSDNMSRWETESTSKTAYKQTTKP